MRPKACKGDGGVRAGNVASHRVPRHGPRVFESTATAEASSAATSSVRRLSAVPAGAIVAYFSRTRVEAVCRIGLHASDFPGTVSPQDPTVLRDDSWPCVGEGGSGTYWVQAYDVQTAGEPLFGVFQLRGHMAHGGFPCRRKCGGGKDGQGVTLGGGGPGRGAAGGGCL
eukprot:gene16008-biopygen21759